MGGGKRRHQKGRRRKDGRGDKREMRIEWRRKMEDEVRLGNRKEGGTGNGIYD